VRHAAILECGNVETTLLSEHDGRAHKLANEHNSPYIFYSCGEDGLFDVRTEEPTQLFTSQPVCAFSYMSFIHLNDIAIDPRNPNSARFSEPADYFCPKHLLGDANVEITGLAFSEHSELLVSYAEAFIYCFSKDTGHRNCVTVKGVRFFGPKCEYVSSGSDCGRIFIWRQKDAKLVRLIEADKDEVNCIEAHPDIPMLACSGIDKDIKIWTPTALEKASYPTYITKEIALLSHLRHPNIVQYYGSETFPENNFEVLKLLENSVEVLKISKNKLELMKIPENKLESLKLQENRPVDGLVPLSIKNNIRMCFAVAVKK
nr:DDB1- and CUL4-associated factor 8-like [Tanacetum cinerariifolium]